MKLQGYLNKNLILPLINMPQYGPSNNTNTICHFSVYQTLDLTKNLNPNKLKIGDKIENDPEKLANEFNKITLALIL